MGQDDPLLNLVTNDWVVDQIWKAVNSEVGGTVHLAHPEPVEMAGFSSRASPGSDCP